MALGNNQRLRNRVICFRIKNIKTLTRQERHLYEAVLSEYMTGLLSSSFYTIYGH